MAPLRNIKRERFCQALLNGAVHSISQTAAYKAAGYRAKGHAAEVAASRLLNMDEVQGRIGELTAPAVRKTRASVDSLAEQLDAVYANATADSQHGAAGNAVAVKAKLLGFMREKLEIGGVGEFDACGSPEEAAQKILEEQGIDEALASLDALRDAIEAAAGHRAIVVSPEPREQFSIPWKGEDRRTARGKPWSR